jgi:hypothetical protein
MENSMRILNVGTSNVKTLSAETLNTKTLNTKTLNTKTLNTKTLNTKTLNIKGLNRITFWLLSLIETRIKQHIKNAKELAGKIFEK